MAYVMRLVVQELCGQAWGSLTDDATAVDRHERCELIQVSYREQRVHELRERVFAWLRLANERVKSTERQRQEIFEQQTTVTGIVRMFPSSTTLVPVFKRFFKMKLYRVDELTFGSLHHHLIPTQVRGR